MTTGQNEDAGSTPAASTKIKRLDPTLKACKCGMIGTRSQLYSHLNQKKRDYMEEENPVLQTRYYIFHGEVPLNEDDPRTRVGEQLKESLK